MSDEKTRELIAAVDALDFTARKANPLAAQLAEACKGLLARLATCEEGHAVLIDAAVGSSEVGGSGG